VRVLSAVGCDERREPLSSMCRKFSADLFPLVSPHPVESLQSAMQQAANKSNSRRADADAPAPGPSVVSESVSSSPQLCFETLVVGQSAAGAVSWGADNRNRASSFLSFRNEMLVAHGLDPSLRPSAHHLLLIHKKGRRGFANLPDILARVQATDRYAGIRITVVDDFKELSMAAQLRLLATATIVLSPCGGVSMIFVMLPPGSALIVPTYPALDSAGRLRAARMEAAVWNGQGHVLVQHYPQRDLSDFVLPAGVANDTVQWRNAAMPVLKPERLFPMIDQAIIASAAARRTHSVTH
jgi:hypothetical protein